MCVCACARAHVCVCVCVCVNATYSNAEWKTKEKDMLCFELLKTTRITLLRSLNCACMYTLHAVDSVVIIL